MSIESWPCYVRCAEGYGKHSCDKCHITTIVYDYVCIACNAYYSVCENCSVRCHRCLRNNKIDICIS